MIFVRAGYNMGLTDETDSENVLFGATFGVGIKYTLLGIGLKLDYAFRATEFFNNNQLISLGFEL
jgi:hypothetical protein